MERRKLGDTGFEVAPLALGGNVFGWTADEAMSFRLLDAFVEAGFNLVDTADSYSRWVTGHKGGESETIIGRWIARRGRHDDVIIATKVGSEMGQRHNALDDVARRYEATPAQISLTWLIAQPGVTAPIASATNLAQLTEILQVTEIKLDNKVMDMLNRAS